jgi:hypothetical protein
MEVGFSCGMIIRIVLVVFLIRMDLNFKAIYDAGSSTRTNLFSIIRDKD